MDTVIPEDFISLVKVKKCIPLFSFCSVWAVTTCWSLHSRRTPACSVGAPDNPATASTTASPCGTCKLVHCTFSTSTTSHADVSSKYASLTFQATTRCSSSQSALPASASEKESPQATTSVSSLEFSIKVCSYTDWNLCAHSAIKNLRGEYYLNGHWVIEFSRATPIAGTTLYYQRGAEGDNVPETITGRGPTTEPLVVEVRWNISHLWE